MLPDPELLGWLAFWAVVAIVTVAVASCVRLSGRDMPTPNAAPTEVALTASAARATNEQCARLGHKVSRFGDTVWACLRPGCTEAWTVLPETHPYDQEAQA